MREELAAERTSGRLEELSRLNVLFCLLVVLAHILSIAIQMLDRHSWQFGLVAAVQRLCTVAVPGFFFLSGVKLTLPRPQPRRWPAYYLGRAKNILLPYLLAAVVHYLYGLRGGGFDLTALLRGTALGTLSAQFYFVIALAQFILLAPLFQALVRCHSPVFAIPTAAVLTMLCYQYLGDLLRLFWPDRPFPYTNRFFLHWLVYFLAGCFAGEHRKQFLALLERERIWLSVCALLSGAADAALTVLDASGRYPFPGIWAVHFLYFFCAIPALYAWAARVRPRERERETALSALFHQIDRASYLIYLYHTIAISVCTQLAHALGITRTSTMLLFRTVTVYPLAVGGCILWQRSWAWCKARLSAGGSRGAEPS